MDGISKIFNLHEDSLAELYLLKKNLLSHPNGFNNISIKKEQIVKMSYDDASVDIEITEPFSQMININFLETSTIDEDYDYYKNVMDRKNPNLIMSGHLSLRQYFGTKNFDIFHYKEMDFFLQNENVKIKFNYYRFLDSKTIRLFSRDKEFFNQINTIYACPMSYINIMLNDYPKKQKREIRYELEKNQAIYTTNDFFRVIMDELKNQFITKLKTIGKEKEDYSHLSKVMEILSFRKNTEIEQKFKVSNVKHLESGISIYDDLFQLYDKKKGKNYFLEHVYDSYEDYKKNIYYVEELKTHLKD